MRFLLIAAALFAMSAHASLNSYRNAHPVGWMHLLPVGETPGWSGKSWINLEFNHANIWNMEFSMIDERTGDIYTYKADFEQSSAILNFGFALTERFAISAEVPYANRNGGFLDDFIDQFHLLIDSDRFLRHLNEEFSNEFIIQNNSANNLASEKAEGVGGYKFKAKYWLLKWLSPTPGACDCGVSLSAQAKFPAKRRTTGLSSGSNDYSGLIHVGAPLGKYAGMWATAGYTKLGPNDNFAGWPRREWLQMYELTVDLGFNKNFGIFLQARTESPLFRKEHLDYQYTMATEDGQKAERIASGWNSLVEWRGSQTLGLRWLWGKGSRASLMIVEDWGTGDKDERGDELYVNNAPDVAFISQLHFVF